MTHNELGRLAELVAEMTAGDWDAGNYEHEYDEAYIRGPIIDGKQWSLTNGDDGYITPANAAGIVALRNAADELLRLARIGLDPIAAVRAQFAAIPEHDSDARKELVDSITGDNYCGSCGGDGYYCCYDSVIE